MRASGLPALSLAALVSACAVSAVFCGSLRDDFRHEELGDSDNNRHLGTVQVNSSDSDGADRVIGGYASSEKSKRAFIGAVWKGMSSSDFYCGASLIAPDVVLTAAHCADKAAYVSVGSLERSAAPRVAVAEAIVHPDFDPSVSMSNDFALLVLESPVTDVEPAQLNFGNDSALYERDGTPIIIAGWGVHEVGNTTDPEREYLYEAKVEIIADDFCAQPSSYGVVFHADTQICAGNRSGGVDTCQGDSGGPLFYDDASGSSVIQVGITSFGHECALAGYPGVYARVSFAESWVRAHVKDLGVMKKSTSSESSHGFFSGSVLIGIIAAGSAVVALLLAALAFLRVRRRRARDGTIGPVDDFEPAEQITSSGDARSAAKSEKASPETREIGHTTTGATSTMWD